MKKYPWEPVTCECKDCEDTETPCHFDCDREDECTGCREARLEQEEIQFEIDQAVGRR